MMRPAAARAGTVAGALALAAAGASGPGCAGNAADWYRPDWERVIEREEARERPVEDVPEPAGVRPQTLPDLEAGGPIELSVEQAVFLALSRNRELSVAQLDPVITGAFELIERGRYDPELFAEAEFFRIEALESARATGEQFSVSADDRTLRTGIRQSLPSGTDIELDITQQRSVSNRAPEDQFARVGLTVTQALLRGFGPAANLATVRQAELETEASRYELRGFVESLLAETEIAYWTYVLAQEEIAIFTRSLEVARQQFEQVRERIEVGVLPETEAAAARTEIAVREQALIDARADLEAARLRLLRLVNASALPDPERGVVPTSSPLVTPSPIEDATERVLLARRSRPDLNEARLRLEQNRLETVRTRNGLLPRLDVFIAYGKTGYADSFHNTFQELDSSTYDFTMGASFSQPLGNRSARGRYEAARASRDQAAASVRNLEQLVELDVLLAVNNVERAREQIGATTTTRELQERTVQAEIERFDVGASTALLVAQAQRDLLQAQINEVGAIVGYRIARIRLQLAEGSILERRGITIER